MGEPATKGVKTTMAVINAPSGDKLLPVAETPINRADSDKPVAWLVGVHGGAGATTLATVLAPFKDAQGVIPAGDDPSTCVLVAQTHKVGMKKLHDAILQFESDQAGGAHLLGVILVDTHPGKLPKELSGDLQRITEAAPSQNVWRIPYVEQWRTHLPKELPEWRPGQEDSDKLSRKEKRERANPLRFVPAAIAKDAEDMFDRALTAYHRNNS